MSTPSSPPTASITHTQELVDAYLLSRQRHGLALSSLRWYRHFLGNFAERHPDLPKSRAEIEEWIAAWTTGDERRYGAFRTVRAFYNWLYDVKPPAFPSPMHKMRPPKVLPKEKRALTLEELKTLLEYPGHRPMIRALLWLLGSTGIRIGEAANLTHDNVFARSIRVNGKTGWREIPINQTVRMMLVELRQTGRVFPSQPNWLSKQVSKAFRDAGIDGTAHTLRHTFCTVWRGSDQALKTITGHKSWEMIENYSHRKLEKATTEYEQYSPIAQLYGAESQSQPTPTVDSGSDGNTLRAVIELSQEVGALKERIRYLEGQLGRQN